MNTKKLIELPRDDRVGRTYQRIVYRRLVDLQTAIRDCRRQRHAPLGVLDELDTEHLIEQLVKIADIDYRSPAENPNYKPPVQAMDNIADMPVITVDDGDFTAL